jgi:hypothetical protein
MDRENTARLLRIVLLFGSAILLIAIIVYVDYLNFTQELFLKLVFLIMVLPLTVPAIIYLTRFALNYEFKKESNPITINSRNIKQIQLGESNSMENRILDLSNKQTNKIQEEIDTEQVGNVKGRLTNNQIELTVSRFLKKTNRYGFLLNDEIFINSLLYSIQYEYGKQITRDRLIDCLKSNHKYQLIGSNEIVNTADWEQDKIDWRHIRNGEPEKVGTRCKPKEKEVKIV